MSTITKTLSPKITVREDFQKMIGALDIYDYFVTSMLQRATLLEEEEAILIRQQCDC